MLQSFIDFVLEILFWNNLLLRFEIVMRLERLSNFH